MSSSLSIIVADTVGSLQGETTHPRPVVTYLAKEGEANAPIVEVLHGG